MSISVSGVTSTSLVSSAPVGQAFIKQLRTASIAGSSRIEDTVQISAAAQATLMHQSGQSVESIASSLGTGAATVDSYLGVAGADNLPAPVSPTAHAASARPAEPALATKIPWAGAKG